MKPTVSYISGNERGATMIEAMFVLPILFSTVFFIVWYSRTMHESNMMNEAMYRAGKIASTIPNLDLSLVSTDAEIGDKQKGKEFRRAARANTLASEAANNFLTSVGFYKDSNEKELFELKKVIQRLKPDGTNIDSMEVVGKVMALLPGECASYNDSSGSKTVCNNRTLNPSFSDSEPLDNSKKQSLQPQKILLKQFPIKIISIANRSASLFSGGGAKEFNFFIVREPIPPGPFAQDIEDKLLNGPVEDGAPPEPLKFGVPGDETVNLTCFNPATPVPTAAKLVQRCKDTGYREIMQITQTNPFLCIETKLEL